jgi:hypothetical protein
MKDCRVGPEEAVDGAVGVAFEVEGKAGTMCIKSFENGPIVAKLDEEELVFTSKM